MKTTNAAVVLLVTLTLPLSASLEYGAPVERPQGDSKGPQRRNPIRLEGQIREVTSEGGTVTIRLHRDRYPIAASSVTRVRWLDGRRAAVDELQKGDSIRVEGDLDQNVIYADRITLLQRVEHRGGR